MITALIAIVILLALVAIGVPLTVSIAGAVVGYMVMEGSWIISYPQQVIAGMNGFILLAMPLFILAGIVMNGGGISHRIFDFAKALVGSFRGGLAHVNVMTSLFFGGMIGTSVADLAGTGSVMIPEMKRNGYPGNFSVALTASASGIGPMVPPSSPMILYAAVTGTSLGTLFLAGIIPGILLALALMTVIAVQATRRGWGSYESFVLREVLRTGKRALLAFGLPAIIVGGLAFGLFTPTEAGAFAAIYAILVSIVIYRGMTLRNLYQALISATVLTGEVMLIVGVSVAFGAALARARVPDLLADVILTITPDGSQILQILALLALAVVAGMVLDPLIPVLMPIILPALLEFDIDLVHFGVLIVITVVIGQVTPPVAMSLVVAGKIGRVDLWDAFIANMPFLLAIVLLLLLIVLVPSLATWLPAMLA